MKVLLSVLLRHSSKNADDLALAQKLAGDSTKSADYSQEQELEADALSVHYMTLAGYDPHAVVAAIRTDAAKTALDDGEMKGNPVAQDLFALDQSHPATPAREAHAEEAVKLEAAKNASGPETAVSPKTDRDAYLAAIDGMTFGDDPVEGTVDGRRLVNAALGFSFEAPDDFDLWTGHGGAFGLGPKAGLVIETTEEYTGQSLTTYVQSSLMTKMTVTDVRPLEIDGYRGATGIVTVDPFVMRVAAVHDRGKNLYKLLYVAPRREIHDLDAGFLDSLKSFHPLEGAEATPKPALRLRIVTVASGDTVKSLAESMAVKEKKLEWFRVLNGLGAGDEVKAGDKVKVVEAR
jgi:predicted Zn-dependent protease